MIHDIHIPPIPMLLWCPACGERHVDAGDYATRPHHTHACQECGMVWRPAIAATVGVRFLPGFRGSEPGEARPASARTAREDGICTGSATGAGVPNPADTRIEHALAAARQELEVEYAARGDDIRRLNEQHAGVERERDAALAEVARMRLVVEAAGRCADATGGEEGQRRTSAPDLSALREEVAKLCDDAGWTSYGKLLRTPCSRPLIEAWIRMACRDRPFLIDAEQAALAGLEQLAAEEDPPEAEPMTAQIDKAALVKLRERCAQEADYERYAAELRYRDGNPAKWAAKHIREIDVDRWLAAGMPDRDPKTAR